MIKRKTEKSYQIGLNRVESKNNISRFSFKNPQSNPIISNIHKKTVVKSTTKQGANDKFLTVLPGNRQGGDGAAQVGDEDFHGTIVEFEDLCFLICHAFSFTVSVSGPLCFFWIYTCLMLTSCQPDMLPPVFPSLSRNVEQSVSCTISLFILVFLYLSSNVST